MTTASPAIRLSADGITYGAPGVKMSFAPGATVYAKLDSTGNVDSTTWEVISTDDTTHVGDFTLTTSGIVSSVVTFTAGGVGSAGILQDTINAGQDKQTGTANPLTTMATVKWWVPAANGLEMTCYDEHAESGAWWWMPLLNAAIRMAGTGTGVVPATPNTVPQRDNTGKINGVGYDAGGAKVTSVATPTTSTDAANKGYADMANSFLAQAVDILTPVTGAPLSGAGSPVVFKGFRARVATTVGAISLTMITGAWTADATHYWRVIVYKNGVGVGTANLSTAGAGGTGSIAQKATVQLFAPAFFSAAASDVFLFEFNQIGSPADLPIGELTFDLAPA